MALIEELKKQGDFLFRYRSYLPLALLVLGLAFKVLQVLLLPEQDTLLAEILEQSAIFVGMLGLLVRMITVGYTPRKTSGRNTKAGQVAETLNQTGMYSMIRNPLYLGNYLMWLGVAMLTANLWFILVFTLVFWIYYERIVFAEEAFLRGKFGKTYLDWAEKTPPFLPKKFRWVKPDFSFSWRKALKKEKNGLVALFIVFYLFDLIESLLTDGSWMSEKTWLFYGLLISLAFYLVLRILDKTSSLLKHKGR